MSLNFIRNCSSFPSPYRSLVSLQNKEICIKKLKGEDFWLLHIFLIFDIRYTFNFIIVAKICTFILNMLISEFLYSFFTWNICLIVNFGMMVLSNINFHIFLCFCGHSIFVNIRQIIWFLDLCFYECCRSFYVLKFQV